jgi:hypothetical protein
MDSLNDILSRKDLDEPPEVAAIKRYVEVEFHADVGVKVQSETIVIMAKSAALANTLRMRTLQIQKAAETTKKLVLRIEG